MNKRGIWIIIAAVSLSAYFWIASRYPDLNAKALIAEQGTVADTISAYPIYTISPSDTTWQKILYTTANWANDNRKGMTYGVLMAALLFTLMSYIRFDRIQSRWWEKIAGLLIGTPLGLCVNCSAPVFKGILRSRRLEMSFTAMFASPTLNIVVLTMVFSLFPFYVGVIKVAFTLFAVFVVVPLLNRTKLVNEPIRDFNAPPSRFTPTSNALTIDDSESWTKSIVGAGSDFIKNLWFMIVRTVPLMLLAGFLGAAVSHLINLESVLVEDSLPLIALTAIVGVFLPVPMAFDVMLSHALYQQGLPMSIVVTLLCTLGIFSVYSFSIVWTSASPRWALHLFGALVVMGFVVGVVAQPLHEIFYTTSNVHEYLSLRAKNRPAASAPNELLVRNTNVAVSSNQLTTNTVIDNDAVRIKRFAFQKKDQTAPKPFIKREGYDWGITDGFRFSIIDYPDPFWIGRGTAAGDFNRDGWPDLVLGSETGFYLYKNIGGKFQKVDHHQAWIHNQNVYAVAFVDFNNDGWPDLFFSTYRNGNFILMNNNGLFDFEKPKVVPNNKGVITVSPAFADINGDGFIDIYNGNMALGVVTGSHDYRQGRENSVVYNRNLTFEEKPIDGVSGESMSTLISDINNDGIADIYVGQDFIVPDKLFMGQKSGIYKQIKGSDNLIPTTPIFSMGADSGDYNNDGRLDFLITGTIALTRQVGKEAIDGVSPAEYKKGKWGAEICRNIHDSSYRQRCQAVRASQFLADGHSARNLKLAECRKLSTETDIQDCLLSAMWTLITRDDLARDCNTQFKDEPKLQEVCDILKRRGPRYPASLFQHSMKQENQPVLYQSTADGTFINVNSLNPNQPVYKHPGGWTWNTRFIDLDNDGWLDIFNAEGAVRVNEYGWNVFMKNVHGEKFEQHQFQYNLTDDFNLFSYAAADFDLDGDVDIIGNSSTGPVQIYENTAAREHSSIAIALEDTKRNFYGIGAKIKIEADEAPQQQLREIKASGGYQSFDIPVAYFGLDRNKAVRAITVTWPDGKNDRIEGPFDAGFQYTISRK